MPSYERAPRAPHLARFAGRNWVAVGMARQGYDLQLTRDDERLASHVLDDRDGALADERDGVLAGCENWPAQKLGDCVDKALGDDKLGKGPVEKAGRRSTRRSTK
jgi:hypothetical protein